MNFIREYNKDEFNKHGDVLEELYTLPSRRR